ncbi:unnamed protein product [Cylindrotheca closterium]|uniref:HSF-type DNA-binding domain-containing protein n=1 Tax=Cylindrotheca closterium TaxID=2856 RepID=A0AAD2GD80_9STRA|nr:unnamed protein product [Cylindrotheca closterium]
MTHHSHPATRQTPEGGSATHHLSFPEKVYHVLKLCEENGRTDVISWVNDGTALKVHNLKEFEQHFLPNYFNTKKYASFTRTLCAYGFSGVRTGRQPGIYSHPAFNRNDPATPCLMRRIKKKRSSGSSASSNSSNEASSNNRRLSTTTNRTRHHDEIVGEQRFQFPSYFNGTRCEDHSTSSGIVGVGGFCHSVASQAADRLTHMMSLVPPGSDLVGTFESEDHNSTRVGSSRNLTGSTSSIGNSTSSYHHTAAISPSDVEDDGQGERQTTSTPTYNAMLGAAHVAPTTTALTQAAARETTENRMNLQIHCFGANKEGNFEPIPLSGQGNGQTNYSLPTDYSQAELLPDSWEPRRIHEV